MPPATPPTVEIYWTRGSVAAVSSPTSAGRVRPASTLPARAIAEMRVAEFVSGDACALCQGRTAAEQRSVDAVIAEAVTDVGVRRRLDAAGGYCALHAALLPVRERARRGGTLGSAVLLGSVLRARLDALDAATASGGRRLAGRVASLREPANCPVCRNVESSVGSVLTVVIGRLGDPAWAEALAQSALCLDDLLLLWHTVARSNGRTQDAWRPIGTAQVARLRAILATADAYVDHSGHDRQAELTDEERAAADGLVRVLAAGVQPNR